MSTFTLENKALRFELDRTNGALVRLTALRTGWHILDRPQLGLSFRLLVPLSDDLRNNPVYGEKQSLAAEPRLNAEGRCATLVWDDLASERGGRLPIRLTLQITLEDEGAVYAMTVENRSPYVVENVYCPYLGDVQHPPTKPSGSRPFSTITPRPQEWSPLAAFDNMRGYYGVDYPTQFLKQCGILRGPMSPFFLLRGQKQGLYAGVASPSTELGGLACRAAPRLWQLDRSRVPEAAVIAGKDVATRFAAVHVPIIQPGETRSLTPVALEPFTGRLAARCATSISAGAAPG